jgi:hypothetical protein
MVDMRDKCLFWWAVRLLGQQQADLFMTNPPLVDVSAGGIRVLFCFFAIKLPFAYKRVEMTWLVTNDTDEGAERSLAWPTSCT